MLHVLKTLGQGETKKFLRHGFHMGRGTYTNISYPYRRTLNFIEVVFQSHIAKFPRLLDVYMWLEALIL